MTEKEKELLKEVYGELYEDLVRVHKMRTVCEVLREVYWETADTNIRPKIMEAMVLAKKMSNRLTYYWTQADPSRKDPTHGDLFQKNPFSEEIRKEKEKVRRDIAVKDANENNRNNVR